MGKQIGIRPFASAAAAWLTILSGTALPQGAPSSSLSRVAEKTLVGKTAPEFTGLTWLDGENLALASLRGSIVVLLFWNSSFQEFHPYVPEIVGLSESFQEQGVRFLGISVESEAGLRQQRNQLGISFPLAVDPMVATLPLYRIANVPTAVVIDPYGNVHWVDPPYRQFGLEETLQDLVKRHGDLLSVRVKIDRAIKAKEEKRIPEAMRMLKEILAKDAAAGPALGEAAVKDLLEIETEAMAGIRDAHRWLLAGKTVKAMELLEGLAAGYPGTYAGGLAQSELNKLRQLPKIQGELAAQKLLATAQEDLRRGKPQKAREAVDRLLRSYPDTEAAETAKALILK